MEMKNIENELRRLLGLVEGWGSRGEIPAIERDLALDKLKMLYEELRFTRASEAAPTAAPAAEAAPAPTAGPAAEGEGEELPAEEQPLEIIDLDEVFSAEPMPLAEPEEPMPEAAYMEPAAEHTEPVAEPEKAEHREPAHAAAPEPAPRVQESLFGLEEVPPVHRRDSRRVLMALYGDNPATRAVRPHRAERREEAVEAAFELPVEEAATHKPEPAHREPEPVREAEPAYGEPLAEAVRSIVAEPEQEPQVILSNDSDNYPVNEQEEPTSAKPLVEAAEPFESAAPAAPEGEEEEYTAEAAETAGSEDNEEDEEVTFREIPVVTVPLSEVGAKGEQPTPVLGEMLHAEVRTVADTLARQREGASVLAGNIENLRSAIGINDRFQLIGELFGGDAARYEEALDELEARESLDDCMIYIAENYTWNPNSEGAKLLFDLLERKFGEY